MTYGGCITVMGTDISLSGNQNNSINPHKYDTNRTDKVQYKDAIQRWAYIICSFEPFNYKSKGWINMIGLLMYMECDAQSKSKLRTAETEFKLILKGKDEDPYRTRLIKEILGKIESDTQSEKIQRKYPSLAT